MKRLIAPCLLLAATSLFAGCGDEPPSRPTHHRPAYTQPPPDVESDTHSEVPSDSHPDHESKPHDEPSSPAPKNNPPPAQVGNYEYGKPVPGKPGFVTSPYEPYQGYIDVRGFPPGTEVKDPYTGKVFLVPAQ